MRLGPVLCELEDLYAELQDEFLGLPDITITIQTKPNYNYGSSYKRSIIIGWKAVLAGGQTLVETVLHEAAHIIQWEQKRGVGNKPHDSFFRDACTVLGLENDVMTDKTLTKHADRITRLDELTQPARLGSSRYPSDSSPAQ